MRKSSCFIKKIITLVAVIASICGILFIFKDSVKDILSKVKEKFTTDDDFDSFDDNFEDDDEIFEDKSDREYVSLNIGDEDEKTAEKSSEEESDQDSPEASEDTTEEE